MTSYVAAMQAAWLAWAAWGRAARRTRCTTTGSWFDVSSYGPKAVDATLRVVGVDRLVHGTDRPVVDPLSLAPLGPAVHHAITRTNPAATLLRV